MLARRSFQAHLRPDSRCPQLNALVTARSRSGQGWPKHDPETYVNRQISESLEYGQRPSFKIFRNTSPLRNTEDNFGSRVTGDTTRSFQRPDRNCSSPERYLTPNRRNSGERNVSRDAGDSRALSGKLEWMRLTPRNLSYSKMWYFQGRGVSGDAGGGRVSSERKNFSPRLSSSSPYHGLLTRAEDELEFEDAGDKPWVFGNVSRSEGNLPSKETGDSPLRSLAALKKSSKHKEWSSEQISKIIEDSRVFRISQSIQEALLLHKPIVALETTIYTHGFPHPDNIDLALSLEEIILSQGAFPATIGIMNGVATIGLSHQEIKDLCSSAGHPETMKVSRRDLPYILGMGLAGRKINGGTTISGTMVLAERAGIKVFGTGGLGGVHRGGQDTMDISADLTELGRTPVAVISSGCKSFLDLPRTLEYLETQGATVCTFADGRAGEIDFPSFYTRDSGLRSPMVVQSAHEAAAMIYSQEILGSAHKQGMLFANPIPEEHSIPKEEIDIAINQAVQEAAEQGFHGHANTPFILSRIKELTKGNSIPANRALIQSNVKIAAQVAIELAKFRAGKTDTEIPTGRIDSITVKEEVGDQGLLSATPASSAEPAPTPDIIVFGSVALDLSCDYTPKSDDPTKKEDSVAGTDITPRLHTSNIATITPSIGGVGHNVALAAYRAAGSSLTVRLRSVIGDDLAGNTILSAMKEEGLETSDIKIRQNKVVKGKQRTAQYVAINDQSKDLVLAMADMSIFAQPDLRPKDIFKITGSGVGLKWAVVDANWHQSIARHAMQFFKNSRGSTKVAFEPVSIAKSAAIFESSPGDKLLTCFPKNIIDLATPNQHELAAMHASAKKNEYFESKIWWKTIDALGIPSSGARERFVAMTNGKMTNEGIPFQTIQLLPFMPTILTKLGPEGVLLTELLKPDDARLTDPDHASHILSRCANGSTEVGGVYMRLFPAVKVVDDVVSVNGVGDTFLGILVAGLARDLQLDEKLINIAQCGAVMTLRSKEAVSPQLGELAAELDELVQDANNLSGIES